MKPRPNSLYARLLQAKKPDGVELERLDELMLFLMSGGSYEDGAGLCHEWGIPTSESSIYDLYSRYAFSWKLDRAQAAAAATGKLPSFEKEIARLNQQAIFETVANPNTEAKVHVALRALEIEKGKLDLARQSAESRFKLETEKLEVSKRRVTVLEAKLKKAQDLVAKAADPKGGGLTPKTLEKIKEALGL